MEIAIININVVFKILVSLIFIFPSKNDILLATAGPNEFKLKII
jgi:hypothetical protein